MREKRKSLHTSPTLYLDFRELLREQLEACGDKKSSYLLEEFESKLLDPLVAKSPEQRRTAAIDKWLLCENTNRVTNQRIMHMSDEDVLFTKDGFPVYAEEVLLTARRFIVELLGEAFPWNSLSGSFSGGASTSLKRGVGTIARKYLLGTDITQGAIWHFLRITKSSVWAPRDFHLVRGNVMFTVPKTSEIDRCAAKEPDYNMYVQKAAGDEIRRRLKRVGINLNDQTSNQRLARLGSIEGNLATVDLSSASDSVTTQLVLRLLPDEWFDVLSDLRSPETEIDGVWHLNEMFSSMGNGFTFELESMIFWALARAAAYHSSTRGRISVYADDIICPVKLEQPLLSTLEFFGFKVNPKKSFFSGSFRESCGVHAFNGEVITPFYVRKVPVDVSDWCHLLNSLRRWAGFANTGICDPRFYAIWSLFAEIIPRPLWGGSDLNRRDYLVAPNVANIAVVRRKQRRMIDEEKRFSEGAYLHWMDVTKDRDQNPLREEDHVEYHMGELIRTHRMSSEVVTSVMSTDGDLRLIRSRASARNEQFPVFPEEVGTTLTCVSGEPAS